MKKFYYKAKKDSEIIEGNMAAFSTQEVVNKLAQEGCVATCVKDISVKESAVSKYAWKDLFRVGLKDIISFSRQLAVLLKSKVSLLQALNILSGQSGNAYIKHIIDDVTDKVRDGETLSESLGRHPNMFSAFYIAMVKAGEESGSLDMALTRLSDYYIKQAEFISKVRAALAYPILILAVGFLTILFIFTYVIPRIIPLLLGLNVKLPLPTRILIGTSNLIKGNWFPILLFSLVFLLIIERAMHAKGFKNNFSLLKLKTPFLGDFIFKSEFAKFARAMQTSLHSGIPIIKTMSISVQIVNEPVIRDKLSLCLRELELGGSLGNTLKNLGTFPPFVFNLISIGEESGRLDEVLSNIAFSFESDCEEYIKVLTTLLEPVMVLVIGLVVGFIVSAVLLPIFQLNVMQI